jgi:hypothetical protein
VADTQYTLSARVSTDRPRAVRPVLERLFGAGSVEPGDRAGEFRVEAVLKGASARELNRGVLTELRRAEKRTRLRAEWTSGGITEKFFDYVSKGRRRIDPR